MFVQSAIQQWFNLIHQAWTLALGNADDMRTTAGLLDKVDGVLVAGYAKKTGKSAEVVTALMKAETRFTAEEAIAAGFANSLVTIGASNTAARAFNVAAYANAPKALTEPEQLPDWDAAASRRQARARLYERSAA
ncbi:ATP-dependent Clp protease proteolytic subunit [Sphingomonas sp.]|uniref:ATP-dependent Clp protease proteolytic subunit n=1 Tax=Sphingomonas sp. TaxID=28214 RepID=UPI003AFF65AA